MMLKRLKLGASLLCVIAVTLQGQTAVTPIALPHVTFVDGSGAPCTGCKLYSYTAGTTSGIATFKDSLGIAQNTNPVVLDVAGGANIWLGKNAYKFILKDALGSLIWSVDNVNPAHLFVCATAGAVQIGNATHDGLTCDATVIVDTIGHALLINKLKVDGATIDALGTPTAWTLDVTSAATAKASLGALGNVGAGTIGQVAVYAATGSTVQGATAIPNGITATTQPASDNSTDLATTAFVAAPGIIHPTSVQVAAGVAVTDNQGTGAKVQHSTGAATSGNCAKFDASGNTVDAGAPCTPAASSTDYYFSFTGCTLNVSSNASMCSGSQFFSGVSPVVPTQADTNFLLICNTLTTQGWGSSTGVNSVSTTGFTFAQNVDRYNGISATVTPTVWCHFHRN